MGVKI